jgi:hypothetical protein
LHSDISTISANPALLDSTHHQQISATYLNYLAGINMGVVSAAYHQPHWGTFGTQLRYMNYGSITRTDVNGTDLGSFTPQDIALQLHASRELLPRFRGGVQLSLIHQRYDQFRSTGLLADFGVTYHLIGQQAQIGVTLQSVGGQLSTFNGAREPIPLNLTVGYAQQLKYLPLRLHIGIEQLHNWDSQLDNGREISKGKLLLQKIMLGVEFDLGDHLQARLGYQSATASSLNLDRRVDPSGLRAGIGLTIRAFQLDVGYHSFSSLGGVTMLTLRTNWTEL